MTMSLKNAATYIYSNFSLVTNNSPTKYGTSSLIRNCFSPENISFDTEGRVIVFSIGSLTFGNVYFPAGTDSSSRSSREKYCSEVLPNILVNRNENGVCGGD